MLLCSFLGESGQNGSPGIPGQKGETGNVGAPGIPGQLCNFHITDREHNICLSL